MDQWYCKTCCRPRKICNKLWLSINESFCLLAQTLLLLKSFIQSECISTRKNVYMIYKESPFVEQKFTFYNLFGVWKRNTVTSKNVIKFQSILNNKFDELYVQTKIIWITFQGEHMKISGEFSTCEKLENMNKVWLMIKHKKLKRG